MFKGCEEEKEKNPRNLGMGGKKKWEKDGGPGGLGDSGRGMSNGADCRETVTQRDAEGLKRMETQQREKYD